MYDFIFYLYHSLVSMLFRLKNRILYYVCRLLLLLYVANDKVTSYYFENHNWSDQLFLLFILKLQ
jgi:hypothetical protein